MTAVAPQIRGERLVAKVLDSTLHELANVGYHALSIEVVAEHAGVNKTTIYRRWPTKVDLVRDAFRSMVDHIFTNPDEGSLRADLIAFAKGIRDIASTRRGRAIFRVMAAEGENTELGEVMNELRKTSLCIPEKIMARAVKRGEVPLGSDGELIVSCVAAPILNWVQMDGRIVDDARVAEVVDLVLDGARRR